MSEDKARVVCIFGTRPEAIKMAPVVKELARRKQQFASLVCVTSQHRDMLDQVLEVFAIRPDFDLNLMRPSQDLFDITTAGLTGLRPVLAEARPDVALVHGDTTTTMAAALACYYLGIPVGHVEAGLRTGDKRQPFPEEMNRRIADSICDLHFAPTTVNREALLAEGVSERSITVTGNTVVDALLSALPQARDLPLDEDGLADIDWSKRVILVTCHRRESFGSQLAAICEALHEIASLAADVEIIYPVHKNPNVLGPVHERLGRVPRVHLLEPQSYLPFIALMDRSTLVLTDSGGVQEEAPSLDKPVLVMRNKTERTEAVTAGSVRLVGTARKNIVDGVFDLLEHPDVYAAMARAPNPYGDGKAAQRIADALWQWHNQEGRRAGPDGSAQPRSDPK